MDCLTNFRRKVGEAQLLSPERLDEIDGEVLDLIESSVQGARTAPLPSAEALFTNVYNAY